MNVESVAVDEIYELRMEVLRRGTPSDNVALPARRRPGDPPPRRPRRVRRRDRRVDLDAAAVPRPSRRAGRAAARHGRQRRPPGARPRRGDDRRRRSTTPVAAARRWCGPTPATRRSTSTWPMASRSSATDSARPTPTYRTTASSSSCDSTGRGAARDDGRRWRVITLRARIAVLSTTPRMPNTTSGGSPRT